MERVSILQSIADWWNALLREQQVSVIILGICGVLVLGISVQRMGSIISDPFTVSKEKIDAAKRELDIIDPSARLEAEARRRDTDGDGMSDWDEEHLFQTSPYLRDTDGDGSPDNVELALGQNPNCQTGTPCTTPQIDVSSLASSTSPVLNLGLTGENPNELLATFQKGINQSKQKAVQNGSTSTALEPTLIRDPKEIRAALLKTGQVDAQLLQSLTDAQLLEIYDTAMIEAARQQVQQTGVENPFTYTPDPTP